MFGTPIRDLHLELTSRCTLECPRCQRTSNPSELSVQDVECDTIFGSVTRKNFPDVRWVNLCGNYGDPIYHRRFHEIIRHFKKEGFIVRFDTNGSYRTRKWWDETAQILTRRDRVTFSIDGLEDTNHIYRVNARWPDIMAAVEEMRGKVVLMWKFIVFKHNQHQIDEAMALAKELGFDEFKLMRSHRFNGRWLSADGTDHLKPDEEWLSDRMKVVERVQEIRSGRN